MDDKIVLYSTHCPRCSALKMLLEKNKIPYEEKFIDPHKPEEIQVMLDMGLVSAPGLAVGGKIMDFSHAVQWIKEQ